MICAKLQSIYRGLFEYEMIITMI